MHNLQLSSNKREIDTAYIMYNLISLIFNVLERIKYYGFITVLPSILLPLTFLTSIFGMQGIDLNNIHSIPQGFVIILAAMSIIAAVLFYMFWKRQWIFVKNTIVKDDNSASEE